MDEMDKFPNQNRHGIGNKKSNDFGLLTTYPIAFQAMIQKGWNITPRNLSSRMVLIRCGQI